MSAIPTTWTLWNEDRLELDVIVFNRGTLLSAASPLNSPLEFILCISTYSQRNANRLISLCLYPTGWPCEVLIVPQWLHSWPIISHKSRKGSRTSDRWLSHCLLIARVYLLIIFCIPYWSRNLISGGMDQTQWGNQFPPTQLSCFAHSFVPSQIVLASVLVNAILHITSQHIEYITLLLITTVQRRSTVFQKVKDLSYASKWLYDFRACIETVQSTHKPVRRTATWLYASETAAYCTSNCSHLVSVTPWYSSHLN